MQNVLADLAVESEAATISAMRLARAYDEAIAGDEEAANLKRIANAVLKYWICKRAPMHAGECARVPRRQRLRRGVGDAPPLPREPAQLDLGGLRQRPVPRRPAGDDQVPRLARGLLRRGRGGRGRRAAPRRLRRLPARRDPRRRRDDRGSAPAAWSSGWPSPSRPRSWSATATRPSPTPSAPPASPATGARPSAPCPPGTDFAPHHRPPPRRPSECGSPLYPYASQRTAALVPQVEVTRRSCEALGSSLETTRSCLLE